MEMKRDRTRRDVLKGSLALAGLGVLGLPEWVLPALAANETLEAFTDIPDNVRWETPPDRRLLDVRTIDGPFTVLSPCRIPRRYLTGFASSPSSANPPANPPHPPRHIVAGSGPRLSANARSSARAPASSATMP